MHVQIYQALELASFLTLVNALNCSDKLARMLGYANATFLIDEVAHSKAFTVVYVAFFVDTNIYHFHCNCPFFL